VPVGYPKEGRALLLPLENSATSVCTTRYNPFLLVTGTLTGALYPLALWVILPDFYLVGGIADEKIDPVPSSSAPSSDVLSANLQGPHGSAKYGSDLSADIPTVAEPWRTSCTQRVLADFARCSRVGVVRHKALITVNRTQNGVGETKWLHLLHQSIFEDPEHQLEEIRNCASP